MSKLEIQVATADHAAPVWEMLVESFSGPSSRYTAVGQEGYGLYLADLLSTEDRGSKTLVVGKIDGEVAAFADLTIGRNAPNFLTRIAVEPKFRGLGVARRFMKQLHEVYGEDNPWELDVFHSNEDARRLYTSLDFNVVNTSIWIGRLLPRATKLAESVPEATQRQDAKFMRYGFTKMSLEGRDVSVVGSAIRCHEFETFSDDLFLRQVQARFGNTDRTFIILNETTGPYIYMTDKFVIDRSYRMRGSF